MEYRILDFLGFPYMERYVSLHFRDRSKAVALRYRHRATSPFLYVNKSLTRYDSRAGVKAIQYIVNIALMS